MSVSIIIATYGESVWEEMSWERALPSTQGQGALEVLVEHFHDYTIAEARNAAAARAKGDWLVFLDADDELAGGYIRAMERRISSLTFYEGKRVILIPRVQYVISGRPRAPKFLSRRGSLQDDNFIVVGAGIQRWDFEDVGGFSDYPHGFEDWSLWAKSWKAGADLVEVPQAIYVAYVNPNSKHRTAWRDRTAQVAMHHHVRRELFPELYELDTP